MKPVFLKLSCGPDGIKAEGDSNYYHGNAITEADGRRNGVYSEWSWNGVTLNAGTCRYGMSPLFYYCGETEFYLSNSIPKLLELGAPSDWDDDAMAVFIRRQTFLGEDTPFKQIRATPPGAKLTWTNGKMTLEGQAFTVKPQTLKRSAMVDGVIELFAQSISRRLPQTEDFYLPLTGGKDSRHILLELARQSALPKACVTASFPPPLLNQDKEIAGQLADRLGIPHVVLPPATPGSANERRKNLATNFCTLEHGWALPLADFLQANTAVSYDGLGLDVFFNTIWYSDYRAKLYEDGAFEALAIDLLGDSEAAFAMIFTPEINRRFSRTRAIARMVEELKLHADQIHPIASFQFWSRSRRSTNALTFCLQDNGSMAHTPFLDHDLFDLVYSFQVGDERAIHSEVIAKAYPEIDGIAFAKSGRMNHAKSREEQALVLGLVPQLMSVTRKPSSLMGYQVAARIIKASLSTKNSDIYWLQPFLIHYIAQLESYVSSCEA